MDGVVLEDQLSGSVGPAAGLISTRISLCHMVCGPLNLTRVQPGGPVRKALLDVKKANSSFIWGESM
jgi:hypothetical protein